MARKKKSNPETTIVNNNNIGMQYVGNVKLSITTNGIVTKTMQINNNGTTLLFQQLALSLINFSEILRPEFIAVGSSSDGNTESLNNLVSEIPNSRTPLINKKVNTLFETGTSNVIGYNAQFTGTEYYSTIGGIPIKEIGLYGKITGNTLLARIKLEGTNITLQSGQTLIIDWTMSIQNK